MGDGKEVQLGKSDCWPQSLLIFSLHGLIKPHIQPGPSSQFSDKETEAAEVTTMFAVCHSFFFFFLLHVPLST